VGAAPPSSAHPDADLLTAFAERSLNERERARVVEHLAHCAVCRDVVYFAQPEIEAPLPATAGSPAPIRWFAWRRLQWAALAASLSLVVALAILVRENPRTVLTGRTAGESSSPQTVAQSEAKNDAPAPTSTDSSTYRLEAELREAPASPEKQGTLKPEAKAARGAPQGSVHGYTGNETYFGNPGLSKSAGDDVRSRALIFDKEATEKDGLAFTSKGAATFNGAATFRRDENGNVVAVAPDSASGVRGANGAPPSSGLFDLSPQKVQSGPNANTNNAQSAQNTANNFLYVDQNAAFPAQAASNQPAPPPAAAGANVVTSDLKRPQPQPKSTAEPGGTSGGPVTLARQSAITRPVVPAEDARKKKLETIPAHATPQATEETVAVAGKAQDIDAAHAETSGVVAADRIQELPLNGRNYANLTALTPGVVSTTPITDWRVHHGRLQGRLYGIWHDLILRRQPGAEDSSIMEVSSTSEANAESKTSGRSVSARDGTGGMLRNIGVALQHFTSVAKSGIDVWAVEVVNQGRNVSQLVVHHSRDGGATWQPSTLTAQEALKSDAEADVRFKDAQQGEIVLPTGEKWQTSDGGTHWTPVK
jgi:hypothetical protein